MKGSMVIGYCAPRSSTRIDSPLDVASSRVPSSTPAASWAYRPPYRSAFRPPRERRRADAPPSLTSTVTSPDSAIRTLEEPTFERESLLESKRPVDVPLGDAVGIPVLDAIADGGELGLDGGADDMAFRVPVKPERSIYPSLPDEMLTPSVSNSALIECGGFSRR